MICITLISDIQLQHRQRVQLRWILSSGEAEGVLLTLQTFQVLVTLETLFSSTISSPGNTPNSFSHYIPCLCNSLTLFFFYTIPSLGSTQTLFLPIFQVWILNSSTIFTVEAEQGKMWSVWWSLGCCRSSISRRRRHLWSRSDCSQVFLPFYLLQTFVFCRYICSYSLLQNRWQQNKNLLRISIL